MWVVVNGCFTADMNLSAFICGENSELLVIVAVVNRDAIALVKSNVKMWPFLFNIPSQI